MAITQKTIEVKSSKKPITNQAELGFVLPQARSMEKAVLGAIMIDKEAIQEVSNILTPDCFYQDAHTIIYEAMLNLRKKGAPIDLLSVTNELTRMKQIEAIGGSYYLVELTNRVASTANAEYHARIIMQKYLARRVIYAGEEMKRKAIEDATDVFDLIDEAKRSLAVIDDLVVGGSITLKQVKEKGISDPARYPTPPILQSLDIYYLLAGAITLAGARPKDGKSTFAYYLLTWFASENAMPVALIPLENSVEQSAASLLSVGLSYNDELIHISQLPNHEVDTICNEVVRLAQRGVKLIVLDWIGLVTAKGTSGKDAIANAYLALQKVIIKTEAHLVILAQLKRPVEDKLNLYLPPNEDSYADSDNGLRVATDALIIHNQSKSTETYEDGTITKGTRVLYSVARRNYNTVLNELKELDPSKESLNERIVVHIHPNNTLSLNPHHNQIPW